MSERRFRILGPLEVTVDGEPVAVTAGRDRVVLAALLLNSGRIVGFGELARAVWDEEPPATARGQLQTCVSRLRRMLPDGAIRTDPAGYGLTLGPDELDANVFLRLLEAARSAADPGAARAAYREALDLWRGPACAEIDAPAVRQAAAMLDERRAVALEDAMDLELEAGRARELLGELAALVDRFPLRERLRGQLMLALLRAGRQGDALAEFRRARDVLRGELGIEPGHELQQLHRDILAGAVPGDVAATGGPAGPIRCLPRTVRDFTGRQDQVDRLIAGIAEAGAAGPVVAVLDGMAGSGKTTLALHLAGLLGDRYPDAHLFVDLQGHSEQDPVEPAAALLILLRQLGVTPEEIPAGSVERVGFWRNQMAGRRSLIILDNVATSTQIADLLPSTPGSLALVTGRRRLAGLDGIQLESLPVLAHDEAVTLLERIVGERVRAEPEAAAEVVRRCGGLPLAVRLAGARLAHRPRWRVADLLRRLGESALPELAAEDRTLAGALTLTYRQLPAPTQRVFRLLGVHPGTCVDDLAVAALAGLPLDEARDVLDELVDVHLLEEPEPDVFRLHDLLREYARMLAADLPAEERRGALEGVLDLQLHALIAATAPNHRPVLTRDIKWPQPERPDLVVALEDPHARLERERPGLVMYVEAAAGVGRADLSWKIARAAWQPLYYQGYTDDVRDLNMRAMAKIKTSGDRSAIATIANYLASVYCRTVENREAEQYLLLSIRLREELGEHGAVATGYGNLGTIYYSEGRFAECIEALLTSRRIRTRNRYANASNSTLATLTEVFNRLGRHDEALYYARLWLFSVIEHRADGQIAGALRKVQQLKYEKGVIGAATAHRWLDVVNRLASRSGYRSVQAEVHHDRAVLLRDAGRYAEAIAEHEQAVALMARLRDLQYEVEYRHSWATTLRLSGDLAGARAMYVRSLRMARATQLQYSIACAGAGLAACLDPGDPEAVRLRRQARELYHRMGIESNDCDPR
ncbi:BTAD domain-containing putative transcriptional regulator [Actinoplanes sp. NEAU-A12]|uniref:BTAD domain-containing putative transcriptional regulator n=1 Tax=Actinoplanes sandaracinus TaxID=3045177 RepID=A0ABT6WVT5_9ACTN|nr:AfsR/SARP family transcriptional regulator [Actinoplanes sandaracinus]MDI6103840.1 BTAD domain-containing putative transcriptional regulator [Actinoplanes sandaracinus]